MFVLLSFFIGFLSLSQELVWVRLISFALAGAARTFGMVLGAFLIGIACGAKYVDQQSKEGSRLDYAGMVERFLYCSIVTSYFFPFLLGMVAQMPVFVFGIATVLFIVINGFFLGAQLPLLSAFAIKGREHTGLQFSILYFGNILGSTLGSLVTGFLLMDFLTIEKLILVVGILGVLLIFFFQSLTKRVTVRSVVFNLILTVVIVSSYSCLSAGVLEKFYYKNHYRGEHFKYKIQKKEGIITVIDGKNNPKDIVLGHGVYDGKVNIDLVLNSNGIDRVYYPFTIHPHPRDILMIGIGSGAWARVVSGYSDLDSITIIEINPGYSELIAKYKEVRDVLQNRKTKIVIDDGRRWLARNSNQFDMIVMNTTFSWRSYTTNLLSKQFLQLAKKHLRPAGILHYNATDAVLEVQCTAAQVFKYVFSYDSFVTATDEYIPSTYQERRVRLLKFNNDGLPVFRFDDRRLRKVIDKILNHRNINLVENLTSGKCPIITDDNILTEYG